MKIVADENIPFVADCFKEMGQVVTASGRAMTPELVADAEVLLVRSITKVNEALTANSKLKFVATATIGVEHVDHEYLNSRGIGFASAPGSNATSVAEWVVAALLALGKKHKFNLEGKSIGIIGVGNVGSRVETRCRALGMQVVLNDPPKQRETGDNKYRSLDEAIACDFVTMHTPLTREGQDKTFHLCDESFFARMKPGAFFFNSSRGGVHDTAALKKAIADKAIAGTVLDVWEGEPSVDPELLLRAELSTPHIAGYSYDGKIKGLMMIYQAACEHLGIELVHTIKDFLPEPEVPEIHITEPIDDIQQVLHSSVQHVYVINRDDFNMREILIIPEDQRAGWFDGLRKNYLRRREFSNTTVIVPKNQTQLAKTLEGLEFKIQLEG